MLLDTEYLRFLQTLNNDKIPSSVRKIANIVLHNMDILIPLTTAHGQRIRKIVELAQKNWDTVSEDVQASENELEDQRCPFIRVKNLTVGPFRGFTKEENINLDSKIVLVYGPNGTGKSSLCEALEYSLLGNVIDADNKRFRDQRDYYKNAYTNSYKPPVLEGIDENGNVFPVTANEALNRFCFIEKNRIDSFSRIAAQLPAKQAELISTLFGLDAFSDFVGNFTEAMDKYIDLEGEKGKTLLEKTQVNAGRLQYLEGVPDELKKIEDDEKTLANEYQNGCTYTRMVLELKGDGIQRGRISQIEAEMEEQINAKTGISLSYLSGLKQSIDTNIIELQTKQQMMNAESQQLSYKQLYEAIVQVQRTDQEWCPACHTPLSIATINPYTYAKEELDKLEHLNVLQNEIDQLERKIKAILEKVSSIISSCCSNASLGDSILEYKLSDEQIVSIDWWETLHKQQKDGYSPWQALEICIKSIEEQDKKIDEANQKREELRQELNRLRKYNEKIIELQTRRDEVNRKDRLAKEEIDRFKTDNIQLIVEVEAEKNAVKQNKMIAEAYVIFVRLINEYKDRLPAQLVTDLGETIIRLYNAFNRHDSEHEQLAAVKLPLQQNEHLEISYRNNPAHFYDVLHIFSEGHIRCMGLAILAAKNIKENCPILIFDDPVNAIDDDHRESIRITIFSDEYFENKQIILTCHGEEFLKDISNTPSSENAKCIKTITFLPRNSNNIRIDQHCPPRNYIIAARTHFDNGEIRDALDKSRKALECLAKNKIWSYVRRFGDGELSIKMDRFKAPIELRNLVEQLKKKIAKDNFSDTDKDKILLPLESLLGVGGDSREWRYLNKGTHEETELSEFDRQTVEKIIASIEMIDNTLK